MSQNRVRITGGNLRGSYINFLDKYKIKPTKSYIREVIFNTIPSVYNFHCLDLFSGSGILTAESFSRGANKFTLIEKNKNICKTIEKEFKRLNIDDCNLFEEDVLNFLKNRCSDTYDLIFLDPPYHNTLLEKSLKLLQSSGFFINCSYLFFEQTKKDRKNFDFEALYDDWNVLKDLSIGEVSYTIAKKRN
ncbi:MAG: RsmD family RNA methyltransferase [Pseudomonadota bacterium]|nr:RsmD family RNA methyltransferase [Pseudomonadota bacterium]